MKKLLFSIVLIGLAGGISAKEKISGKVIFGGSAVEGSGNEADFGGLYMAADVTGSNNYFTAAGKIYYRLALADDSKDLDKEKTLSQKIDLKKAYLKVRPLGKESLEFSVGKLYSYYLPGNFFSLSEVYTGSSRWGKTGLGVKYENYGLTLGLALPVTENYVEFKNGFGINGAVGYDFKTLTANVPLKAGVSVLYDHAENNNVSATGSLNYSQKFADKKFSFNSTLSYSWNSEPYVSSSVFKNISNYNAPGLNKSQFISINQTLDFSKVKITVEGEAGHSLKNDWIPLYSGLQTSIKITESFSFRPRFYYYAALNTEDHTLSRQTFEVYPKLWFEKGKIVLSAGADFSYKQVSAEKWQLEWNIPFFAEYKI